MTEAELAEIERVWAASRSVPAYLPSLSHRAPDDVAKLLAEVKRLRECVDKAISCAEWHYAVKGGPCAPDVIGILTRTRSPTHEIAADVNLQLPRERVMALVKDLQQLSTQAANGISSNYAMGLIDAYEVASSKVRKLLEAP